MAKVNSIQRRDEMLERTGYPAVFPPTFVPASASGEWGQFRPSTAIIVNPDASPGDMLSWCFTELEELARFANLMMANPTIASETLLVLTTVAHRVGPTANVLEAAVDRLAKAVAIQQLSAQ